MGEWVVVSDQYLTRWEIGRGRRGICAVLDEVRWGFLVGGVGGGVVND